MRQILFRGKRLDNAEWVEGNLNTTYYGGAYISTFDKTYMAAFDSVDPTTVGQYTGLKDKNGKRIFEGDIIKAYHSEDEDWRTEPVTSRYGTFSIGRYWKDGTHDWYSMEQWESFELEVIGNIHDKGN